ncbi:MAG: dienelactone hydrolase family protein [Verrucomicrobia bacterium]|nr:dienelactone hydrolase family protein [Verrucomicrobiota bacterium]
MDLQQPPPTLPPDAPKLAAIAPADVAQWRKRWTQFLFGGELPQGGPGVPHGQSSTIAARDARPTLNVREDRRDGTNDVERIHITYDVEPGVATEAYVLRPKNATGKLPGVVVFHPTSTQTIERSGGLDASVDRNMGIHLARRGYVAIVPKNFLWGAAGEAPPANAGRKYYEGEVAKMQQRHPKWKGMARMVWDGIRAVDVLVARPDVDPARIGCIGHSLGAKESVFLPAFDGRVKAAVSSDGGIGLGLSNWHDPWYLGPEIRAPGFELENHQLLAMMAPCAFLLAAGKDDNERSWPFIASALPLWKSLGAPGAVGWYRHTAGHNWPPDAQEVGYEFFDRYLKR